ncbi:MAG: hypothetical protein P9L94_01540 [Candidatus Hinthialibacter antarcticus]|nr:hypothetical protein [Candidatus Hinthialibacter antarcticus]
MDLYKIFKTALSFVIFISVLCGIAASAQTWHDLETPGDAAPVDVSFLLDAPAGKHGFLGVKNGQFIFEDGTRARFWGTTVTGSGCFPSQAMAPKIADRIARLGFNLVRFHWMDAGWAQPALIQHDDNGNATLNPQALDRLDYFLFQLENRGVYAFFDGLDARTLSANDNVMAWENIPAGWKGYIHYVNELRDLHANLLDDFWSHRNPYAGWDLRQTDYRDEPAIALTQLFESNTLNGTPPPFGPYILRFDDLWRKWLQENQTEYEPFHFAAPNKTMRRFMAETTARSQTDFAVQLRSLGLKVPISGTDVFHDLWDLPHQAHLDFMTSQSIWNAPFGDFQGFPDQRMAEVDLRNAPTLFSRLAFARLHDKPFVVSGWGNPWPNRFRAELPLWMAATASAQDWSGCIASTYASNYDPNRQFISAPFEMQHDPSLIGLMPAAALLFHQQQVKPLKRAITMGVEETVLESGETVAPDDAAVPRFIDRLRIETQLNVKPNGSSIFAPTQPQDASEILKRREQPASLRHDPARGQVLIQTDKTLAVIGRINALKPDDLEGLVIESEMEFGAVCVSSMDDKEIKRSRQLLLTILSESQNTGFKSVLHPMGRWIQEHGGAPIQISETPARIFLQTEREQWTITPVNMRGDRLETLPYQIDSGMLSFNAGNHSAIYYLLESN